MSCLDPLIPFILYYECGLTRAQAAMPPARAFEEARRRGYSDDPYDRGGATMCGVTLDTYRAYAASKGWPAPDKDALRQIPYDCWRDILHRRYWQRWQADSIRCQPIANLLVDWVWASGTHGIRIPQRLLGVSADGVAGPVTLAALNAADPESLFGRLHAARHQFVDDIVRRNPSQRRYLRGWLRRLDAITWEGLRYE